MLRHDYDRASLMTESCLIFCSCGGPLCMNGPLLVFRGYDRPWFLYTARNIVSTESPQGALVHEYHIALSYNTVLCSLRTLLDPYKVIVQNFSLYDAIVWGTWVERGYTVAQLAEALCSKPEGRGFDSR